MKYLMIVLCIAFVPKVFYEEFKMTGSADPKPILIKKNFYLITALEQYSDLMGILPGVMKKPGSVNDFKFSKQEKDLLLDQLASAYAKQAKRIDQLLDTKVRPSGSYQLYASLDNKALWLKCWEQYFTAVNYIIDIYGLGRKFRYPAIDSASYVVEGDQYQQLLKGMLLRLKPEFDKGKLFYMPSLNVALELLLLNNRDEAARLEPIDQGENKAAIGRVKKTNFSGYKYCAMLLPGEGPEEVGVAISDGSMEKCNVAAARFKTKLAPFIILSGGYCHPFQTSFCEALEMKKYLVQKFNVPASAIIIDPHARHTTTNFRNAGRYLIGYGFPLDKPAMLVTAKDQADYIADPRFGERNMKELGYLPYKDLKRISDTEFSFFTVPEVRHRDAIDPLDP